MTGSKAISNLLLSAFCVLSSELAVFGAAWTGILDPSRATDWTHTGAAITNRTTACTTSACNTVSAGTVTTASLNAAIASAPSNTVINIPAGTYTISSGIQDTGVSNITIRGAGPLATTLQFTGGSGGCSVPGGADFCFVDPVGYYNGSGPVQPGGTNACNWTGGYAQGTTSITLNSCGSKPPVNQFIILDQASDSTDNGGVFVCNLPSCNNEGTVSQVGREINNNSHAQQQFVYVTGVSGSGSGPYTVTIAAPGLYMNNWSEAGAFTGTQMGAWWPGMIQGIGIENLTLDHSKSGSVNSGLSFYDGYNCWVKNIRSIVQPAGSFSGRNQIWLYQSMSMTIRDSYFFGTHGNEEAYGIETLQASQNLFENNIFHYVTAPLMNGSGSGNVESYNYLVLPIFSFNQMNWQSTMFAVHNVADQMNLYEGNVAPGIIVDDDWGTGPVSATIFRNYFNGHTLGTQRGAYSASVPYNPWDIVSYNGSSYAATRYQAAGTAPPTNATFWFQLASSKGTSQNTNAVNLMWGARGINVIGNVLGDSSYDTQYLLSPTSGSPGSADQSVYSMGFRGVQGTGAKDNTVQASAMLWGNYDMVNAAVRWNATESSPGAIPFLNAQTTPPSQTLPSSFYLTGKPSWWGSAVYPAIGPDVSGGPGPGGYARIIPAQTCYANGTFTNGVLNFDANTCYGSGGGGGNPPVITSSTTATGTVGTAFSYQITATNNPTSYNATGLPAGLSVKTNTGVISGTPTVSGVYTPTISATNASGQANISLTLTLYSACDLNQDNSTNVMDVQLEVNMALGVTPCTSDINKDGVCNDVDVQRVMNAAIGGPCVTGP